MRSTPPREAVPATTPAASLVFTTLLSHGPLTRAEIAQRTLLSAAAVTKAVRPLMEVGYLVEGADDGVRAALGRPANRVRVDGGRALFIGIKVTGDEIIAVLADLCCRVRVARHVGLTGRSPEAVLPSITALVQELLTEADGFGVGVQGLGIAVSGDVDRRTGTVRYSPFLEWRDIPLAEIVETATGLPVTVDNDVRALTVAEQWFGAGVGLSDFALVTVGAGIGCGLVVHGRVVSGAHGVAGEIGHLSIDPLGPPCHCGNNGCVEAIAADPAILRRVREATGLSVATAAEALDLAHRGDPGAREVYARAGEAIGRAIGSVVNVLGPERVIISGEGLAAYDLFAEGIRDALAASAFGAAAQCDVMTRPLPFEEWARGAAATAIQSFIGTDTY
ncbi:ROK family transcriptional regulator [Streptomyces sp. TS71-3]|uniref:ROK family transcriptional regulator n=1 Tax=Streptomyces sp. TS71-3 TaxID=2733862 RepID=UPI001BB4069F|nr:ROK family transcriptional regulator [Streptomyces sp. TS71-3]